MIQITQIERDVFVAAQLVDADFAALALCGFRSVVNNRPDGEAPDQLLNWQARAEAIRLGLEFRYFPVTGANITDSDIVDAFARLIKGLPGPMLFYCGTGRRSAMLWTQVEAAQSGVARALDKARKAGFDLEILREDLIEQASERAQRSNQLVSTAT